MPVYVSVDPTIAELDRFRTGIRGDESYFPRANRVTSLSAAVAVFFCHNVVRIFRRSEIPSPIVLLNSNDDFIPCSHPPAPVFSKQQVCQLERSDQHNKIIKTIHYYRNGMCIAEKYACCRCFGEFGHGL